jgi:hypothetical protein
MFMVVGAIKLETSGYLAVIFVTRPCTFVTLFSNTGIHSLTP